MTDSPSQPLARVTFDLDGPRGVDVLHRVVVPRSWALEGAQLRLTLPRALTCAACGGGGCDACERSGAVKLRGRDEEQAVITISLTLPPDSGPEVLLRVPAEGGASPAGHPAGHLLLTIRLEDQGSPSPGVSRVLDVRLARELERRALMGRSVILAVVLVITFIGMLRLSGWL